MIPPRISNVYDGKNRINTGMRQSRCAIAPEIVANEEILPESYLKGQKR